jgi:S-adenosylmethionine:tRNA ribosyltransferase-isomerase
MNAAALVFDRPAELAATAPPERRGLARDEVRLLVSNADGHHHAQFHELDRWLKPGDLVVVNVSATLPASLPAQGSVGEFILNLSTRFGKGLWLAEPRWSAARPGPLPLVPGERIRIGGEAARLICPHPGLDRLWFVRITGVLERALACCGEPIRYGYVQDRFPLADYQTLFARVPGSAEMPSAARPFTPRVVRQLAARGVRLAPLVLHTGVSSLEVSGEAIEDQPLYPEPFIVPARTARAVNAVRERGGRVIAAGTTVVRALESAWDGERVAETRGFTRLFVHPGRGVHVVDGLITGFHDPSTSHLAMLHAIGGPERIAAAYGEAIRSGYLWHEFGDSHLILP